MITLNELFQHEGFFVYLVDTGPSCLVSTRPIGPDDVKTGCVVLPSLGAALRHVAHQTRRREQS